MLLAERLVARGSSALVITRAISSEHLRRELRDGYEIVRVRPAVGLSRFGKYLMIPAAFVALFRERHRYDVLVVCDFKVLGVWGILAARIFGKRVYLRAESCGEMDGSFVSKFASPPSRIAQALISVVIRGRNRLLNSADGFLSISSAISAEMRSANVPEDAIIELTNGVDLTRFSPPTAERRAELRRAFGWPDGQTQVLFTGRLARGKGLEHLLEAWRRIKQETDSAHLTLVGSGQGFSLGCEEALKHFVERNELGSSVTFTGNVDNVEEYLQAADVFTFPSESEGLGLSLVEAMACGLACIASRTGGIVDVIDDGVNGRLVPPGDVDGLYAAIKDLISNRSRAEQFGIEGRRKAEEKFDIDQIADRYPVALNA